MQLICAFVFAYAKSRFSYGAAHVALDYAGEVYIIQHGANEIMEMHPKSFKGEALDNCFKRL